MEMEKVREAVDGIKEQYGIDEEHQVNDWLQTLVDLGESVLSVAGKMPRKDETHPRCACDGWNSAIDACTLAFAGRLDKINILGAVARGYCTERNKNKEIDYELAEDIADAIIKAIKGE